MPRPKLEVADVFRRHGEAWREAQAGHLSRVQLRVMSAIETCRTAALGGHVEQCVACAHTRIAYNSCRNRHCPKCQGSAASAWLAARTAELLPVPYFHVVFTLPAKLGAIAYQNKALVYGLLFKVAAETLTTIAADPKRLGARIGVTAVLHTWGQALDHHPHIHCIVPGGGYPPMVRAGFHADPGSSFRCGFSHACSGGCFWTLWRPPTPPASFSSSPRSLGWKRQRPLRPIWILCAEANGWSTPSAHLPVRPRFWPIWRATRIGSRSPTVG